jgi:endonuclease/exonuclease/phosphatase family metal-dependent hydrolase
MTDDSLQKLYSMKSIIESYSIVPILVKANEVNPTDQPEQLSIRKPGRVETPGRWLSQHIPLDVFVYAVLFLFFIQLVTSLVESAYAFGLLTTSIPYEAASIFLLFTPLVLWIFPGLASKRSTLFITITGEMALLCRPVSAMFATRGKLIFSGLGAGLFLLFILALLWKLGKKGNLTAGFRMSIGLALAVLLSILLRSIYSGNDASDYGLWRAIPWLLALAGAVTLPAYTAGMDDIADQKPARTHHTPWRVTLQMLGITSIFVYVYFAFSAPTVIARWTNFSYPSIALLLPGAICLFLIAWLVHFKGWETLTRSFMLVWNLLFVATITATLWSFQTLFPVDVADYPLFEIPPASLSKFAITAMLLLSPVLFIDFALLVKGLIDKNLSLRRLAGSFSLAALFLMLMILMQIFTSVYDYIPVAGAWFRNQFWLTLLIPGLVLLLALLVTRQHVYKVGSDEVVPNRAPVLVAGLGLALAAGLAVVLTGPHPARPVANEQHTLRILQFNIQQGYSETGIKNFNNQLAEIRKAKPDIIGLEETDDARISGGNSDVVRYFTERLNYYSYYGPKTVLGTFGVALLSRYPILRPRTFFMYSTGEQTAAIEAQISAGGKTYNVLVTHLGNGGPLVQQQEVLSEIDRLNPNTNLILMGDFNFTPADPPYQPTVQRLEDAWKSANLQSSPPDLDTENRIDHIFLSPGMRVLAGDFYAPGPSDHPMLVVEVGN